MGETGEEAAASAGRARTAARSRIDVLLSFSMGRDLLEESAAERIGGSEGSVWRGRERVTGGAPRRRPTGRLYIGIMALPVESAGSSPGIMALSFDEYDNCPPNVETPRGASPRRRGPRIPGCTCRGHPPPLPPTAPAPSSSKTSNPA